MGQKEISVTVKEHERPVVAPNTERAAYYSLAQRIVVVNSLNSTPKKRFSIVFSIAVLHSNFVVAIKPSLILLNHLYVG